MVTGVATILDKSLATNLHFWSRQTRIQLLIPNLVPTSYTMLNTNTCKETQKSFSQTSVVKHIEFVKLQKCAKDLSAMQVFHWAIFLLGTRKTIAFLYPEGSVMYVVFRLGNRTSALNTKARNLFSSYYYLYKPSLTSVPQAPLHLCDEEHKCHAKAKCHLGKCYCQGNSTGNGIFCRGKLLNNGYESYSFKLTYQTRRDKVKTF